MIELAKKLNLSEKLINEIEMLDKEKISVVAGKCLEKGFSALKKKNYIVLYRFWGGFSYTQNK